MYIFLLFQMSLKKISPDFNTLKIFQLVIPDIKTKSTFNKTF